MQFFLPFCRLSLHPTIGIASRQTLHLSLRDKVEVAIDGVLQR